MPTPSIPDQAMSSTPDASSTPASPIRSSDVFFNMLSMRTKPGPLPPYRLWSLSLPAFLSKRHRISGQDCHRSRQRLFKAFCLHRQFERGSDQRWG